MRVESCQNCRPDDALVAQSKNVATNTAKSPTPTTGQARVAPATLDVVDVIDIATPEAQDLPSDEGADGVAEETSKDRGVLRLIAEGHFRGAAAARLRLNFFDELDHASLPPLPEADGNGRGYAKFLAEYEARLAASNPETPETDPPPNDELPPTDGVETPPVDGTNPPEDGGEAPPADGIAEAPAPSAVITTHNWLSAAFLSNSRLSLLA